MDAVTQIALGAAVGHATLGRRVGRRALVWGAALGILPDLDMLVPMGDAVADFTRHRSWSHSLFLLTAASPVVGWLASRIHPDTRRHLRGWTALALSVFVTHVLLDCFTVYGTQPLWPLPRPPESWSTVFVIDPAYTLPLLVGIAGAWMLHPRRPRTARLWTLAGLALSTVYLCWTVGAKLHVEGVVHDRLARAGMEDARVLTTPTPFNSLLWRVVVMREDGYAEGYWSVVTDDGPIGLVEYPSDDSLLDGLEDDAAVERLAWFTRGFYAVSRIGDEIVIRDLRMGSEPDYVFSFAVARAGSRGPTAIPPRRVGTRPRWSLLPRIWQRIWDPAAPLP